jgi:hypothetical protein
MRGTLNAYTQRPLSANADNSGQRLQGSERIVLAENRFDFNPGCARRVNHPSGTTSGAVRCRKAQSWQPKGSPRGLPLRTAVSTRSSDRAGEPAEALSARASRTSPCRPPPTPGSATCSSTEPTTARGSAASSKEGRKSRFSRGSSPHLAQVPSARALMSGVAGILQG